jgi:hypothetical protein
MLIIPKADAVVQTEPPPLVDVEVMSATKRLQRSPVRSRA